MKMKTKILISILAFILLASLLLNLVSALTITSVSSNPTEASPGGKVSLEITVENNLNNDATDVTILLDLTNLPFAPYQSSSQTTIGDLDEDDEENVEFDLIADSDANSGTYKIPVKISYTVNDELKDSSGLVSLIIVADSKLDLNTEDSLLIKGENSDLKIKIVNSGLGSARLLSIEIKPVIGIKNLGSGKVYIGDIDSDDFDTAVFKVSVSENAPSMINLPVEISYRDSRNNQINEVKSLAIKTYTEKQAVELGLIQKSNTITIIVSVLILIILYLIYRRIKKARKKRRLEQEV